jgi:hypothetical protein
MGRSISMPVLSSYNMAISYKQAGKPMAPNKWISWPSRTSGPQMNRSQKSIDKMYEVTPSLHRGNGMVPHAKLSTNIELCYIRNNTKKLFAQGAKGLVD